MDQNIQKEIFELEPSTLISLYQLVLIGYNESYYFHSGENGINTSIVFNDKTYYHIPIKAEGFDFSDSDLPRPTLTASNADSFFGLKSRYFKDFVGFPLKRIRTFVKFLDDSNFPNNKNPFGVNTKLSFPVEDYIINKKTSETENLIQFELASPLEKENSFIPSRKVVFNVCQWRYRDHIGCGYAGNIKSDSKGNTLTSTNSAPYPNYSPSVTYSQGTAVTVEGSPETRDVDKVYVCLKNNTLGVHPSSDLSTWALDACPKSLEACSLRFKDWPKTNNEKNHGLPFGGFPGTWKH